MKTICWYYISYESKTPYLINRHHKLAKLIVTDIHIKKQTDLDSSMPTILDLYWTKFYQKHSR